MPPPLSRSNTISPVQLAQSIRDRSVLARAITLVESSLASDRRDSAVLLSSLPAPPARGTLRVALSGPPGVGKSSLLERLGLELIGRGSRVAVLAVDPSSKRTGGSILGDKTRMEDLARHPDAYIRPSPSRCVLGGVARATSSAIHLVEAGGYDKVLVETVGVGQSETIAADIVDLFVLLISPAGGDELQGIKRGIMESADVIVVTKADGDLLPSARSTMADHTRAVTLLPPRIPGWKQQVLCASAVTGQGIKELADVLDTFQAEMTRSGVLHQRRAAQNETWMWEAVKAGVADALKESKDVAEMAASVREGKTSPWAAADTVVEKFLKK
jgi:LAO/AO transport system kinase